MIRRIILDNYMAHAHTVIDLADGLTVLLGPNNCGKSAVVSALQTLCFNPGGDFMVRHGQRECAVAVETDDGHSVAWRRKGGSVSYVIDGKEITRLRRSVPDELHQVLRLPRVVPPDARNGESFDVHFAEQKSPIFMLDESRGRAAMFFASSSDAEKLLLMQRRHRDNVADAKREKRRLEDEVAAIDGRLAALTPLEEIVARQDRVEREHAAILEHDQRIAALQLAIERLQASARRAARHVARRDVLAKLTAPPAFADEQAPAKLINQLAGARRSATAAAAMAGSLRPLAPPPSLHDVDHLARTAGGASRIAARIARIGARVEALTSLATPPAFKDAEPLKRQVAGLARAEQAARLANEQRRCLAALASPPAQADTASLLALKNRISAAAKKSATSLATVLDTDRELADLRNETERWARANPACPVCGGATDPQRILSEACHE